MVVLLLSFERAFLALPLLLRLLLKAFLGAVLGLKLLLYTFIGVKVPNFSTLTFVVDAFPSFTFDFLLILELLVPFNWFLAFSFFTSDLTYSTIYNLFLLSSLALTNSSILLMSMTTPSTLPSVFSDAILLSFASPTISTYSEL